jgi:sugar-specific transcriptional regulator TrmB
LLSQDEAAVKTLVTLGLTVLQAKVYTALAKLGTSTGRITAKNAKVAPQDVYRILAELQEKGLVEKIISKPTMYKATATDEGLSILLQNKKEEYIEAKKQAKILSKDFNENLNSNISRENVEFIITSEMKLLLKLHDRLADTTKRNIDFICPASDKIVFDYCQNYITRALRRGVKIRVIAQKNNEEQIIENPKALSKNPLFEIKYLTETAIPFGMHIFDNQEVTLAVSKNPVPSLWTNSPHVVRLTEVYFENLWNNAQMKYASAPER